jgi:hypothetical protein
MNKKEIDKIYLQRFMESMENDYEKWTMTHCAGADWSWTEYHSADYHSPDTEKGGNNRVRFGFSLNHVGAALNGVWNWEIPFSVLNPFSRNFWRFRKARNKMTSFLENREKLEHLQKLEKAL